MIDLIASKLADTQFLVSMLAAIAAVATVLTLAMPLLEGNTLDKRMKDVALERDKIRARERERLNRPKDKVTLRYEPKQFMRQIVDQLKLGDWLGTETAKEKLAMAGYRGQQAEIGFLFFRLVTPIGLFCFALFYVFVINNFGQPPAIRFGIAIAGAYIGIKAPEVFLSNQISKRQASMKQAFPDALDLLLICVESGMSIELAFRKVSGEIGNQSVPLAEEFGLCTAELSYLAERRQAYENLARRTGLEGVKAVSTALIQAERYGTALGTALRTLAQESRDQRMNEAEKKAAALPPKLTVPMILFFLPVLFVVILTPALVQVFKWK
ncbi:type II secretion system F family protein [Bosea sp. PAMC 26642]|uniref:type II secretion system F family protein n=1 Tax=Bosea sp. (strain PAMC 26642) TaxID=1792307 RepID=UPI0007702DB1|nr:type II secretion system F family protein [Bosea sp. PAMC 26642]AMJ62338.1 type II secretion system protein [Bosea sp. PAMC 26642]